MQLTVSSIEPGKHEMAVSVVRKLLARGFGPPPDSLSKQIEELPLETVAELPEAILDFTSLADAQTRINSHS